MAAKNAQPPSAVAQMSFPKLKPQFKPGYCLFLGGREVPKRFNLVIEKQ